MIIDANEFNQISDCVNTSQHIENEFLFCILDFPCSYEIKRNFLPWLWQFTILYIVELKALANITILHKLFNVVFEMWLIEMHHNGAVESHHARMIQLFVIPFDNGMHQCFRYTNFPWVIFSFDLANNIVLTQLIVMKLLQFSSCFCCAEISLYLRGKTSCLKIVSNEKSKW